MTGEVECRYYGRDFTAEEMALLRFRPCAIVERMAVLDDEIDTGLSLAEGGAGVWSPLRAASRRQSQDLRAQYERERARAKAAEARCEELRQAGMEARSRAGSLKWQLDLAACQKGLGVRFATASQLVHELIEARDEKRLLRLQAQLAKVSLLIVDELGYVPLSQTGSELLFDVFSRRYENGATIVT